MSDPPSNVDGETLDGDPADSARRALVVYHRDGLEVVPLTEGAPVVIGRTEPSDIRPRSRRLSRRHAAFELVDGVVWVEDLHSTNGTFVDGAKITARTALDRGSEVALGSVTISVHDLDEAWLHPLGLERHERFVEFVDAELDRARTFSRPLSVLMIRARDPAGPRLGAWVPKVAERLRLVDRAALYGPDCVEVLLPEAEASRALAFAHEVLAALTGTMAVSIGVASFPETFVGGAGRSGALLADASRAAVMAATAAQPVQVYQAEDEHDSGGIGEPTEGPVVRDPAMLSLHRTIERVACSAISVLIVGETGTGKELIARAIHERSERHAGPMRVINCGAIPETLLESILFGHERGAFTGAAERRIGVFEEADTGTVFLDEIGELALQAQVALLRVLEARRIQRVGASREVPVDVRVVAATHRNLEAMCDDGSFRWDLLYRLNGITLIVPPLRDRPGEIRPMVAKFIAESNRANGRAVRGVAPDALALLERYRWPGNVRELRNTIDRAVVIAQADRIHVEDLPERLVSAVDLSRMPTDVSGGPGVGVTFAADDGRGGMLDLRELDLKDRVRTYEVDLIRSALAACGGNQTEVAQQLGIPRRTLVYKMRAYGIRDDLRAGLRGGKGHPSPASGPVEALTDERGRPLEFSARIERFERGLIQEALARTGGDAGAAARLLGIQRRTLSSKLGRSP